MHIASVDKQPLSTSGSPLSITCKNFLAVTFVVPRERDCMDIYTTLQRLSQPGRKQFVLILMSVTENQSQSPV